MEEPKSKNNLLSWLNSALDTEYSFARLMGEHVDSLTEEDSELRERLVAQISRSESHAEKLGNMIVQMGGRIGSDGPLQEAAKSAMTGLAAVVSSQDTVQYLLNERGLEQELIARYSILTAAARSVGDMEAAVNLETMLEEKRDGAVWFEEHIPQVVEKALRT